MDFHRILSRHVLAALVGLLALSQAASAIPTRGENGAVVAPNLNPEFSSTSSNNCSTGSAQVDLDVNNVRATLYNIGGLFWRGSGAQYEVPAGGGINSIFASGIWVAGELNGNPNQIRFAGSTYSPWEYWPGPLDGQGVTTQARCASFDRFWKVTREQIAAYNASGATTPDLTSWPIAQGAPFYVDTNGNGRRDPETEPRIELNLGQAGYSLEFGQGRQLNLAANERPDIIGDQGIWWVMNDNGNTHGWSGSPALRIEVRAHAFGFSTADAINNTTFYRYQVIYRGAQPLTNSYIALFSDPDLGHYEDDYIGSDLDLGLGFVYNGDADDSVASGGYGTLPPALGYDFFQGPMLPNGERLQVETFFYFTNAAGFTGDPAATDNRALVSYQFMRGIWKDGTPMTIGGTGYNPGSTDRTLFAFPGNPPSFWSEMNTDGRGRANRPDDRRFGVSSGPFTFQPNDLQEVVFGIVWSQAPEACRSTATPQLASLQQLKVDDITVQGAFNAEFALPSPPPALALRATPLDQQIILEFNSETGNNDDLFNYSVESPFVPIGTVDDTYDFEGIRVFQYRSPQDTEGVLIQTFDINNNVTTVVDSRLDCATGAVVTGVVAQGENNGTEDSVETVLNVTTDAFTGQRLRNNTSYYFGVQSYAYNEASSPNRIFASTLRRIEARPSRVSVRGDGTVINANFGDQLTGVPQAGARGQGQVSARVVNPLEVTGDEYEVVFFTQTASNGDEVGTNYRIINTRTNAVVYDGADYYARTGEVAPQRADVARGEGLVFSVTGPEPGFTNFQTIANAGGVLDPPDSASIPGFPGVTALPSLVRQQTNRTRWLIFTGGEFTSYADFVARTTRNGSNWSRIAPFDFEIRYTGTSLGKVNGIFSQTGPDVTVPFELWNIGAGTPNDPSDDYRMIPIILDVDNSGTFNISSLNSPVNVGNNDPYTDWIYFYNPVNTSPGQAGYQAYFAGGAGDVSQIAGEVMARVVTVGLNLGTAPPYNAPPAGGGGPVTGPEAGTIFRISTTKPNAAGDRFRISTSAIATVTGDEATRRNALDLIAITPNPYRGASEYEAQGSENIVRIVNLPAQATVRVFTLSGTLLRTLQKSNPSTTTIDWDLNSEAGLQIASGMYLIHVEARDSAGAVIGERVLKFGLIRRRVQLEVL